MGTEIGRGDPPLVELRGAGVTRGGVKMLEPLDFRLGAGARWAILGENGAGKTTFLRLLRGEIPPDDVRGDENRTDGGGKRIYDFPGAGGPQPTPLGLRQRLALVSGDMQDAFAVYGWAASGLDVVLSGFADGPLVYAPPTPEQMSAARALLASLGLAGFSARRMARLSSGEGRKLLLARALVSGPDVLVLDECLEGLDAPARRDFLALLDRAAAADPRLAVLFSTHRLDELPACLTQALALRSGRAVRRGALTEVLRDRQALGAAEAVGAPQQPLSVVAPTGAGSDFLVRISDASVEVEGARVLTGIAWTIRPGEHWAVLGKNGAGKSTLLALLSGQIWPSVVDGPPGLVEYGFAAPGETVDEVRRRIGVVSAALQATFPYDLTVREAVFTGLDGSLDLFAEPDTAGRARAVQWLEFFELSALSGRRIRSLSRGQLRRVLLARALAGDTALLALDEPMAGLDARARASLRELLDRLAAQGLPLVLVAHHKADLPERFLSGPDSRVLVLREGTVAFCGEGEAWAEWKAARRAGRASPKD